MLVEGRDVAEVLYVDVALLPAVALPFPSMASSISANSASTSMPSAAVPAAGGITEAARRKSEGVGSGNKDSCDR